MRKAFGILLLFVGASCLASARAFVIPEIDPSGAANAFLLISGALLVIRSRKK